MTLLLIGGEQCTPEASTPEGPFRAWSTSDGMKAYVVFRNKVRMKFTGETAHMDAARVAGDMNSEWLHSHD